MSWTKLSGWSFAEANANDQSAQGSRTNGRRMAVDPANKDLLYVGTPSNGVFVTVNAGKTFSTPVGVPMPPRGSGFVVAFDSSGGVLNGKTNNIYIGALGGQIHKSTDAGRSWVPTGGGPTEHHRMIVRGGIVYVTDGSRMLYKYDGSSWT